MDSSLESILSEETTASATAASTSTTQQETATSTAAGDTAATDARETEVTGEHTAPPAEPRKDDPNERHRKGIEAATLAERNRRQAAERERDEARAELERLKQPAKPAAQQQPAGDAEPTRDQFANDTDYIRALARHEAKQLREAEKAEERQLAEQRQMQEREQQLQRVADDIVGKGKQQYPDFDAVINEGLGPVLDATRPQNGALPMLQAALLQSERGHEVAYFLAKNPEEAWRVAQLSPWQMARELTLIETRLDKATEPTATAGKPTAEGQELPETLTQARDARGRFKDQPYDGPTPLDAVLAKAK